MATLDRERAINLAFGWCGNHRPLGSCLPITRDGLGRISISWFPLSGCGDIGIIASSPSAIAFRGKPFSYALDEEYRTDTNPLDSGAPKSNKRAKK